MPNLVGIGLSQVPTNSMLGGLAYQDPEHASIKDLDLKNLSQINSEIADTAVDVFVYDTRKDSDGGAWRKRTQHTSWYNETLGTETRGTRKEFPAVAVIVAELTKLTIYDGDDPDLPMWMVFNLSGAVGAACNMLPRGGANSQSDITSVAFLNAKLVVGLKYVSGNVGEGLVEVNFISDFGRVYREVGSGFTGAIYNLPISGRNSNSSFSGDYDSLGIVAQTVNDVAMTVLPNAPIDDATGLPIPTIAVAVGHAGAANGGVSVIKDNGSVVDIRAGTGAGGYASYNVEFGSNNELIHTQAYNNSYASVNIFDDIPSSDVSASNSYSAARSYLYINGVPDLRGGVNGGSTPNLEYVSKSSNGDIAFGFQNTDAKLTLLSEPEGAGTVNQNSAAAYITSDYNTGWMHGHIKGAFLSDTDTSSVGTELHPNGNSDFASTNVNYITNTASGTATVTNNQLVLSGGTAGYSDHIINVNTVVGQQYVISIDYVSNSGYNGAIGMYVNSAYLEEETAGLHYAARPTGNTYYWYFTADQTTENIDLVTAGAANNTYTFDNWSIKAVEEDRSVNSKGLQPIGTITKSAVATGADLVAYSGFNSSNYLFQPYNSDLNFTDEMMIMLWVKDWKSSDDLLHRGPNQTRNSQTSYALYCDGGYDYRLILSSNGTSEQSFEILLDANLVGWQHLCFTLSGGVVRGYLNGEEKTLNNNTFTGTIYSGAPGKNGLWIGRGPVSGYPDAAYLALLRLSSSVPSREQIKKMYNDEKHLFQENAKATLYGSSNAVTGLAHDDSTDSLHVGTSSGRSEFQGLRRINNTTEAVTTAISASNGLVAEQ